MAHFSEACGTFCDCPTVEFPYIDYQNIIVSANDPKVDGFLLLSVAPDSLELVAQAASPFHIMSAAYGCKCESEGSRGDKYAPIAMDVFADRDFNDTLPAGASLRSIFFGRTMGDVIDRLSPEFKPEQFNYAGNYYSIRTEEHPKFPGEPYLFQIQWIKSNGDTLVAVSDTVIFN